jgi:hypothetical protein
LAESLEFSSKIRPICLSKKGVPEPQKDAIISGWGAYNGKKKSNKYYYCPKNLFLFL